MLYVGIIFLVLVAAALSGTGKKKVNLSSSTLSTAGQTSPVQEVTPVIANPQNQEQQVIQALLPPAAYLQATTINQAAIQAAADAKRAENRLFVEIFKQYVSARGNRGAMDQLWYVISKAYAEGKLTDAHYDSLYNSFDASGLYTWGSTLFDGQLYLTFKQP